MAEPKPARLTKADMKAMTDILKILEPMKPEMRLRALCAALVFTAAEDSDRVARVVQQLTHPD